MLASPAPALLRPTRPPRRRPARNVLADFLDINIAVRGRLKLPVTGLLAASYSKAVQAATNGKGVSAAAVEVLVAAGMSS